MMNPSFYFRILRRRLRRKRSFPGLCHLCISSIIFLFMCYQLFPKSRVEYSSVPAQHRVSTLQLPSNLSVSLPESADIVTAQYISNAHRHLLEVYSLPAIVVDNITKSFAEQLLRKLVYVDLANMRANDSTNSNNNAASELAPSARVFFIHVQNGLGNRLRALASGLAIARATRRVPVVIWEQDAHLGASFDQIFSVQSETRELHSYLYSNLLVLESFPDWSKLSNLDRQLDQNWYSLNYMEKDETGLRPETKVKFEQPIIIPKWATSVRMDMIRHGRPSAVYPWMHVYFKSAYIGRTNPSTLCTSKAVNAELAALKPSERVEEVIRQIKPDVLGSSIGIHIRSRRLEKDEVDVDSKCEYSMEGALVTDYWRHVSRLAVFEHKMNELLAKNKSAQFFVATDNASTIEHLRRIFLGRIHAIERECDDRKSNCAIYAMADLVCLSRTKKIYGSNWSSFSEAARRMGNVKIYLSGRHFGVVAKAERRRRMRWRLVWRILDRLGISGLVHRCK